MSVFVSGLIGHRKSVGRRAPGTIGAWLWKPTDKLVGGADAVLVINDTALPKKATHSVDPLLATGATFARRLADRHIQELLFRVTTA